MADLSPMLERGEDIGPPEQFNVGVRAVGPDFFEEILEANHQDWCLTKEKPCKWLKVVMSACNGCRMDALLMIERRP